MKAVVYSRYGGADQLRIEDVDVPEPGEGQVRVAVRAVSLNGSDMEFLTGRPLYARFNGLFRPKARILGSDVAGVVDAVGPGVSAPRVGDAVYGDIFGTFGGLAEYVCVKADELLLKPEGLTFEQAASLGQAGVIGLQAVRDHLRVKPGQRVLLIGAGGSVGAFAVPLAKRAGAEVIAVDHGSKRAMLEALGADRFVDYTAEDPLSEGARYDAILDMPGRRSVRALARALTPTGVYAIVGGLLRHVFGALLLGAWYRLTSKRRVGVFGWNKNTDDLAAIAALVEAGDVTPAIEGPFKLDEAREAFERLVNGRARGKVVLTLGD